MTNKSIETLPVRYKTPKAWVTQVMNDPIQLLSDHVHLEKKATTNALELLNRWPERIYPKKWVSTLAKISQEETVHLNLVISHLTKRGGTLQRLHRNQYAMDLHKLIRKGKGPLELLDRLLVSALIEVRSCERFGVLAKYCPDKDLARFYGSLWASEFGHYKMFLSLGSEICPQDDVNDRWNTILTDESKIIQNQPVGFRIHSGVSSR